MAAIISVTMAPPKVSDPTEKAIDVTSYKDSGGGSFSGDDGAFSMQKPGVGAYLVRTQMASIANWREDWTGTGLCGSHNWSVWSTQDGTEECPSLPYSGGGASMGAFVIDHYTYSGGMQTDAATMEGASEEKIILEWNASDDDTAEAGMMWLNWAPYEASGLLCYLTLFTASGSVTFVLYHNAENPHTPANSPYYTLTGEESTEFLVDLSDYGMTPGAAIIKIQFVMDAVWRDVFWNGNRINFKDLILGLTVEPPT